MTGAILGGSSVEQAARLQMVIMFMISSSTALSSIIVTVLTLGIVVDSEHRVRLDRIDTRQHAVWRARNWVISRVVEIAKAAVKKVAGIFRFGRKEDDVPDGERRRLLG